MRYARALIPILKKAPSDASSVSRIRWLGAGYARPYRDPKQSEIVGLDRAAAQVFELVQQALRVPAAGEAA